MFICYESSEGAYAWLYVPSGDDVEDTWRAIRVNGDVKFTNSISSNDVDFVNGTKINAVYDADNKTIAFSHTGSAATKTSKNETLAHGGSLSVDTIATDETGHVTGVVTTTYTLPEVPKHEAGIKLSLTETDGVITYSHEATSFSETTTDAVAPKHGEKITVIDSITRDDTGHITGVVKKDISLPEDKNTVTTVSQIENNPVKVTPTGVGTDNVNYEVSHKTITVGSGTDTAETPAAKQSFNVISSIENDGYGHITKINTKSVTLPEDKNTVTTVVDGTDTTARLISSTDSTKEYAVDHNTIAREDSTSTAAPAANTSFTVVDSVETSATGHVTKVNVKTVTLPVDTNTLGKNIVGAATDATVNGPAPVTSSTRVIDNVGSQTTVSANGVYLNHIEENAVKSSHKISGGQFIATSADNAGNITVSLEQTAGDVLVLYCGSATDLID